jgi:hypothetical protein
MSIAKRSTVSGQSRWVAPAVTHFTLSETELARIDRSPRPKQTLLDIYRTRLATSRI